MHGTRPFPLQRTTRSTLYIKDLVPRVLPRYFLHRSPCPRNRGPLEIYATLIDRSRSDTDRGIRTSVDEGGIGRLKCRRARFLREEHGCSVMQTNSCEYPTARNAVNNVWIAAPEQIELFASFEHRHCADALFSTAASFRLPSEREKCFHDHSSRRI